MAPPLIITPSACTPSLPTARTDLADCRQGLATPWPTYLPWQEMQMTSPAKRDADRHSGQDNREGSDSYGILHLWSRLINGSEKLVSSRYLHPKPTPTDIRQDNRLKGWRGQPGAEVSFMDDDLTASPYPAHYPRADTTLTTDLAYPTAIAPSKDLT